MILTCFYREDRWATSGRHISYWQQYKQPKVKLNCDPKKTIFAVEINGSEVNPGICVMAKARSYTDTENISLHSEPYTVKPLLSRHPL